MKNTPFPAPLALATALSFLPLPAVAADAALDAVDVSANSGEGSTTSADIIVIGQSDQPITVAPRGLAVSLGAEQFAAINAFNVEDLMKYAPNFFVRKRFAGDSNGVPGFRGTHSTQSARALVMIDGFVVSNFLGNSFGFAPKWGAVGPGEVDQFDIVYGPYSPRYVGNSMGGIVNITTRDPRGTEAFATVQGFAQPYRQYGTDQTYFGGSVEAGLGLKQADGPWSVRISSRYFDNIGQPQSWRFLTPAAAGAPGTLVTGAVIDPDTLTRVARASGGATTTVRPSGTVLANDPAPIFAADSAPHVQQTQSKLKLGYDDGAVRAQALLVHWWNLDRQYQPDTYLRDAAGDPVFQGRVRFADRDWNANGVTLRRTERHEILAGLMLETAPADDFTARLNLSTYRIASSRALQSSTHASGLANGAGQLTRAGPTGWFTGDLSLSSQLGGVELAAGINSNLYETDQSRFATANWRAATSPALTTRTFGKTRLIGGWVEAKGDVADGVTLIGGGRVDNWRAFAGGISRPGTGAQAGQIVTGNYASRTSSRFSPSLSLQAGLSDDVTLQLSAAMATRFPTVGELFQGSLNGDGTFNPNSFDPNLRAERSRDLNLLLSWRLGAVKLTGSLFYQRVEDAIFSQSGFNQFGVITSSFKNIDQTRQYGVEAIVEARDWPIAGLSFDANAALNNSKTLKNTALPASEGVFFPRIPRWRVNGNARYKLSEAVQVNLGARFATRPNTDLLGLQRGDTFGYTSELFALDARVNWAVTDRVQLSAGVDNITNNRAWVFHPYPQRMFLIEAGWKL